MLPGCHSVSTTQRPAVCEPRDGQIDLYSDKVSKTSRMRFIAKVAEASAEQAWSLKRTVEVWGFTPLPPDTHLKYLHTQKVVQC